MKILITGSNGLLGQYLIRQLASMNHHQVIATSRGPQRISWNTAIKYFDLDITGAQQTRDFIRQLAPDILVHAAGMTQVE